MSDISENKKVERKMKQKLFRWFLAIIAVYAFITITNICVFFSHRADIEDLVRNTATQNISEIKTVLQENDRIILVEEELERANLNVDKNYREFLMKFYEVQNNILTSWLAVLALVFALFAIVIPLCFLKLFEGKRDEIENAVDLAKREADICSKEAKGALEGMKQGLEAKQTEVTNLSSKFDELKTKMENDAKELNKIVGGAQKTIEKYNKIEADINSTANKVNLDKELTEASKFFSIGLGDYNDKKYQEAIINFDKAINLSGDNPDYYAFRARAKYLIHEAENAMKDIDIALNLKPESVDYSIIKVGIWIEMKNKDTSALQKALDLSNEIMVLDSSKLNVRAAVYTEMGRYIEAIDDYELYHRCFPQNKCVYYNMIENYLFLHRFKDVLSYLREYVYFDCYVFEDDYPRWMEQLDKAETEEDKKIASEIRELIETKLIKKPRE